MGTNGSPNDPKHTTRLVTKSLKDNKFSVFQVISTFVGRTEKPDTVPPVLLEDRTTITANYCKKLKEENPKYLTQVRQFKGSFTKYKGNVCKLLTLKRVIKHYLSYYNLFLLFWQLENRNNFGNPD